ncbi:hypothetical protein HK098_004691 [Nowakowskiella sp. JEL0407]|nr:hypothetical protein HK098_004691 [Nowakowskiella sp. JEL0407]
MRYIFPTYHFEAPRYSSLIYDLYLHGVTLLQNQWDYILSSNFQRLAKLTIDNVCINWKTSNSSKNYETPCLIPLTSVHIINCESFNFSAIHELLFLISENCGSSNSGLSRFSIINCVPISQRDVISVLPFLPNLESLELHGLDLSPLLQQPRTFVIELWKNCYRLKHANFEECSGVNNAFLYIFTRAFGGQFSRERFYRLFVDDLDFDTLEDEPGLSLGDLDFVPRVTSLKLNKTSALGGSITDIPRHCTLTSLSLTHVAELSDMHISKILKSFRQLVYFSLDSCGLTDPNPRITNEALLELKNNSPRTLKHLRLHNIWMGISDYTILFSTPLSLYSNNFEFPTTFSFQNLEILSISGITALNAQNQLVPPPRNWKTTKRTTDLGFYANSWWIMKCLTLIIREPGFVPNLFKLSARSFPSVSVNVILSSPRLKKLQMHQCPGVNQSTLSSFMQTWGETLENVSIFDERSIDELDPDQKFQSFAPKCTIRFVVA